MGPSRQEHSSGKGGLVYIINMPCKCALYRVCTLHSKLTSAVTAGCLSKMQLPVFGPSRSMLGPATTH